MFASIFWLFFNPPWNVIAAQYSSTTWLTFFGFAMISVLIPHSLYFAGVRYLTASRAIITATFEPVVAIISAYFILGEILAPTELAGAVLVIIAIMILQMKKEESAILQLRAHPFRTASSPKLLYIQVDMTERREKKFLSVLHHRQPNMTVVMEDIHDPHNVDAILRSADAVGMMEVQLLYVNEQFPKLGRKFRQRSEMGETPPVQIC